jgi:hypothetical protein
MTGTCMGADVWLHFRLPSPQKQAQCIRPTELNSRSSLPGRNTPIRVNFSNQCCQLAYLLNGPFPFANLKHSLQELEGETPTRC